MLIYISKLIESFFIRQIPETCIKWSNLQVEQIKAAQGSSRVYFRYAIFYL